MCVGVSAWLGALLGSGQIPLHSLELASGLRTQLPPAAKIGRGLQDNSELPGGLSAPPQHPISMAGCSDTPSCLSHALTLFQARQTLPGAAGCPLTDGTGAPQTPVPSACPVPPPRQQHPQQQGRPSPPPGGLLADGTLLPTRHSPIPANPTVPWDPAGSLTGWRKSPWDHPCFPHL